MSDLTLRILILAATAWTVGVLWMLRQARHEALMRRLGRRW